MERPQPSQNGHHPTPPLAGGVAVARRPAQTTPTVFPADPPLRGFGALFYALHRFYIGGLPAARLLSIVWLLAAALWAIPGMPGRWWGVAVWLLLFVLQVVLGIYYRRRHYVTFTPSPAPPLAADPLVPQEKFPIYGTGLFGVEGKWQHFTWLPGFYRTFATGEHALLCQVRPRHWLLFGAWLADEIGMWYAFIPPDAVQNLRWGQLAFGATRADALAVTYRLVIPPHGERPREEIRDETLYIAFTDATVGARIYADLLHHLPADPPLPRQQPATP